MVFKRFFKRTEKYEVRDDIYTRDKENTNLENKEDYLSVSESKKIDNNSKHIKVFRLNSSENIRGILERIRDKKTICLVNIQVLKEKDGEELRRAIDKLKKTSSVVEGEVVGFSSNWILISPSDIVIDKN
jgi:SepF-like predicted cell division protein (DUF552 family)